jgi:hypothetical protein
MPFFDNQRGQAVPRKAKKDEPQTQAQPICRKQAKPKPKSFSADHHGLL